MRADLLYDAKFIKTSAVGCAAQAASMLGKNPDEGKKIVTSQKMKLWSQFGIRIIQCFGSALMYITSSFVIVIWLY